MIWIAFRCMSQKENKKKYLEEYRVTTWALFECVFYRSLIRRLSLRNSPSRVFKTETLWGLDNAPSRLRIRKKHGKILMLRFRSFIYFLSYTRSLKCGQLQDWKIQVGVRTQVGCRHRISFYNIPPIIYVIQITIVLIKIHK